MINRDLRKASITSTDSGPIFGVDPWRDQFAIWAQKKGQLPEPEPTERMHLGNYLQHGIVGYYGYRTGRITEWCDETRQHPDHPWFVCTPDALVVGERRGVDAKVVAWDQRHKWGADSDSIPESIQLQIWGCMSVLDYERWDVAALIGGELRIYEIERDREAERAMLERLEEWHRRYVVGDERPPIGGGENARAWLQQAFPTHRRPDLREATSEEISILNEYAELRRVQHLVEERRDKFENQLKLAVADREGLIWPEGRFTWRKAKDSLITDWQSLALALVTTHIEAQERDALVESYTGVKPGSRRIWFRSDRMDVPDAA
jgi:predicted phage-related endonuclease